MKERFSNWKFENRATLCKKVILYLFFVCLFVFFLSFQVVIQFFLCYCSCTFFVAFFVCFALLSLGFFLSLWSWKIGNFFHFLGNFFQMYIKNLKISNIFQFFLLSLCESSHKNKMLVQTICWMKWNPISLCFCKCHCCGVYDGSIGVFITSWFYLVGSSFTKVICDAIIEFPIVVFHVWIIVQRLSIQLSNLVNI